MFKFPWSKKDNRRKSDERPLTSDEREALDVSITRLDLVEMLRAYVAQSHRREAALQHAERRRTMWKWGTFFVLIFFIGWFFLAGLGGPPTVPVQVKSEPIRTIALSGKGGVAHVAFIPINGSINGNKYDTPGMENTEWYIENALKLAEKQKNIAVVILNITSYGGDATASAHGYRMIKEFRERTKIPVIAFISHYAYSGGYYLALGANEIVVDPDAAIGSVGVIMQWFNTSEIGKVFRIGNKTIATGPLKSCIGQWTELTPACRASIAHNVDVTFKRFLGAMSDSRDIPLVELIRESRTNTGRTNGGTFGAADAVARQMANSVETEKELFARVATSIGLQYPELRGVEVIQYDMEIGLLRGLTGPARSMSRLIDTLSDMANGHAQMRAE